MTRSPSCASSSETSSGSMSSETESLDELAGRPTGSGTRCPRPSRSRNKEDIASHYDLGNEFFQIFLDETLTYSSAIFPSGEAALAEASHYKYDRMLSKLGVTAEHSDPRDRHRLGRIRPAGRRHRRLQSHRQPRSPRSNSLKRPTGFAATTGPPTSPSSTRTGATSPADSTESSRSR